MRRLISLRPQMSTFNPSIKIYLDGAQKEEILKVQNDPLVSGFTTNPSLMKKAGISDYTAFAKDILKEVKKPISFEVFADDFAEMKRQALEIKSWADNVYVKIPITNSTGESSCPLIHELSSSGVKLNVTALFTTAQVLKTCEALKGGETAIISVFAGRVADSGTSPESLMRASSEICEAYGSKTKPHELLWASNRQFYDVIQAQNWGAKIITITPAVYQKFAMYQKDPTQMSLETVQAFKRDSEAAGFRI